MLSILYNEDVGSLRSGSDSNMKTLISERMTARWSCRGSFGKPVLGMSNWLVLRPATTFPEFFELQSVMFLTRSAIKAAIALTLMISASVWAAGGYVYDAAGEVSAAIGKNAAQRIAKNDPVIPNTMINTGDKSYAVLKFEDGQVITLQSNSIFQVRKYKYDTKQTDQNNAVFSMFKGGMRFITGLIGQRNKKAFRLATPNATIGIRGTEFMVALVNGAVYSQVVSGSIRMTNDAGTKVFTAGQVAVVSSAKSLPKAISISDLPAGTFSQLETISTQPISHTQGTSGGTTTFSTVAVKMPTVAAGTVNAAPSAANGITAGVPATVAPTAIPAEAPAAGTPVQPIVDFLSPREPDGLPFFTRVAPSSAVSDAALTAATAAAEANISRNEAAAGLFGKHNFTATGIATGEICAFCHAPQGAENKVAAPLWNRSLSTLSDYRAFSTLGSATAASSGSVSMACLSCHDGTQAPNIVINTPSKDGTGSDSINGTKTDSNLYLKGHHPVGMQYAGGGPNHTMPGAPFNLEDFRSTTYSGTGTSTVWWIDTGGNGRQKTDLLLFTRTDPTNSESVSRPYVECASCHDPHRITSPTFLRVANTVGSALCLTCHAK